MFLSMSLSGRECRHSTFRHVLIASASSPRQTRKIASAILFLLVADVCGRKALFNARNMEYYTAASCAERTSVAAVRRMDGA